MMRQVLLRILGTTLLIAGASLLGAGVIGLIEWSVRAWDVSPLRESSLAVVIGLVLAVGGSILVLRAKRASGGRTSLLELTKR